MSLNYLIAFLMLAQLTACVNSQQTRDAMITVQGTVTVEGNEPFTALVLTTGEGIRYIIEVEEAERPGIQNNLPGRIEATGHVYAGEWTGRPHAFLKMSQWTWLQSDPNR